MIRFTLGSLIFIGLLTFAVQFNAYAGQWTWVCIDDGHGPNCQYVYTQ